MSADENNTGENQTTTTEQTVDWESRFKATQSALTQAKQELAALKQQMQATPEQNTNQIDWDWNDPTKFFNPDVGFTDDFLDSLEKGVPVPKDVAKELGVTIKRAREIIAQQRSDKWDAVSGQKNTEKTVMEYLSKTYKGQELQSRISDLEHPRFWESALRQTLEEMGKSDANTWEPGGLPDAVSNTSNSGIVPLDPNSSEALALVSDPKYRSDEKFRKDYDARVRAWGKSQKR